MFGLNLPQIEIVGQVEPGPGTVEQHPDLRPIGIGRVDFPDDGDFVRVEAHQVADRVDADQLHEPADQMLVELLADNGDRALKPGAYSQATFPIGGAGNAVELPASAMIIGKNGTQVAVLDAGGKVQLKTVTIGRDLGDRVQISAGLTPADQVIDNPPDSIQSGDKVQVARGGK